VANCRESALRRSADAKMEGGAAWWFFLLFSTTEVRVRIAVRQLTSVRIRGVERQGMRSSSL